MMPGCPLVINDWAGRMFEIHSLRIGELYIPQAGKLHRDPVHVWLVTDGRQHILVDSGMTDIKRVEEMLKVTGWGGGHAHIRRGLAEHGLTPDDIGHVVLTHMHFDHADNTDLFPNATVVVQKSELFHAIDPTPSHRPFFKGHIMAELLGRKRPKGLRLEDGDFELTEGFRVLHVPSHTPGMQVPVVTTAKGRAALVSDLGDHYKYWYPADPRATDKPTRFLGDTFMAGPIRSESERDWIAAMRRVMDNSDIVVPAHDFRIPMHMPADWWAIPESTEGDLCFAPIEDTAPDDALRA